MANRKTKKSVDKFNKLEDGQVVNAFNQRRKLDATKSKTKKFVESLDSSYDKNSPTNSFWTKIKRFFTINNNTQEQTKKDKAFAKLKNWWPLSKVSGRIFLIYAFVVILGMILLAIPGVIINHDFKWDFLTSLFTTSSAFSDTGINLVNPSADYSFWGQLIILFLIEMGGIGILTFKVVLYLALNKKISVSDANLAQSERGSSTLSSAVQLIRDGFVWLTIIQILAIGILFGAFFFTKPSMEANYVLNGQTVQLDTVSPYHNFSKSLWFAIFHSTSAINNAGFDIASGSSLQPYNHSGNVSYLIQITFMLEWIIGGLGYPTFHDIKRKIKARKEGKTVPFSLFTKLNFVVYFFLFLVGPLAVFGLEYSNRHGSLVFNYYDAETLKNGAIKYDTIKITSAKPVGEAIMDIIFNTTSTRNAGFSTVNINDFNAGSKAIFSILMFIGSAPSSTAGGIRTTTLAIIILTINAIIRDRRHVSCFKKQIPDKTVTRSFAVFFLSIVVIMISMIIIYADSHKMLTQDFNGDASVIELFVLIASAFGTVGLNPFSASQTLNFGALTKIVLIIVMFTGQLGISNTLLIFTKNNKSQQYSYLEEEVVVG